MKAAILLTEGSTEEGGRLLGAADAITERSGAAIGEVEVNEYDSVRALREDMPAAAESAFAAGRNLSLEEAIELAITS